MHRTVPAAALGPGATNYCISALTPSTGFSPCFCEARAQQKPAVPDIRGCRGKPQSIVNAQVAEIVVSDPRHWPQDLRSDRSLEALYRSRTLFVQRRLCPVSSRDDPLGPMPVMTAGESLAAADFSELGSTASSGPFVAAFAQARSLDPAHVRPGI